MKYFLSKRATLLLQTFYFRKKNQNVIVSLETMSLFLAQQFFACFAWTCKLNTLLQLRTMHEDLTLFKVVKSIPAVVAVHIFLGQDAFPQLPWETGSRIPGQPSSQTAVLGSQLFWGYEPAWETQPLEMLDNLQI